MKTFRVVVCLLGLIILLLLIWQLYGVHHGKLNDIHTYNRVVISAPFHSRQSGGCRYAGVPCRVGGSLYLLVCPSLG